MALFDTLARGHYGTAARATALVSTLEGPYRFDSTCGKVDSVRFKKDIENSRLEIIGERLEKEAIFQRMVSCSP